MLSMALVASFRSTEHIDIHFLAAIPLFSAYCAVTSIQTWLSYKLIPSVNTLIIARIRLIITIFINICCLTYLLTFMVSVLQVRVPLSQLRSAARLWWDESWGGYEAHVISAITESMAIFLACPYFISFITDFKRIKSNDGKLVYNTLELA